MLDYLYKFFAGVGFNEPLHSPITHMPMGLVIGALIFFIVALVLKKEHFLITARHVSIMAFVFVFPTVLLGVMDWIHYYHADLITPIKIKMVLASIVLIVLATGIIVGGEVKLKSVTMGILYSIAFVCVVGLGYFGSGIIYGRGLEKKTAPVKTSGSKVIRLEQGTAGIEEKLGDFIPLDLQFTDDDGKKIILKNIINGPTILSIVYYRCPNACDYLLTGISNTLNNTVFNKGDEPNLVTITMDENETTADALDAKKTAFESLKNPFPPARWHFLTGTRENIKEITDSIGFHFIRRDAGFDHPLGLVFISPKGKIVRYITGTDFLPVDIKMSLLEASSGITGPTIARVFRFCFSYNPSSHQYVFNILRVSATTVFALMGLFVLYLVLSGKKRRMKQKEKKNV